MKQTWRAHYSYILLIIGMWLLAILVVNPVGDFPLMDDWAYAKPVKSFVEQGKFTFTDWPAMTLIVHLLIGILFTKLFGFSFTVLRSYVLVCGLLSLLYTFLIYKKVGKDNGLAFISVLLLMFNPLFLKLSYTYMTDVPFFFFCTAAIYYNLEYVERKGVKYFTIATVLSVAAILIRQPAIVIPFAFMVYNLFNYTNNRKYVIYYFAQFLLTGLAMVAYEFYLRYKIGYPHYFINRNILFIDTIKKNPFPIVGRQLLLVLKSFLYIGLFTLPLAPFVIFLLKKTYKIKVFYRLLAISFGVGIIFTCGGEFFEKRLPFAFGNILTNLGLGSVFWICITCIATAFAVLLFTLFYKLLFENKLKTILSDVKIVFPVTAVVCYMPLISVISFFDRYIIFPLFICCWLFLAATSNYQFTIRAYIRLYTIYAVVLFLFVLSSLLATKDYLTESKAKWLVLNDIMYKRKISPYKINGGIEYNGWYKYMWNDRDSTYLLGKGDEKYLISFYPEKGYHLYSSANYQRYMPYTKESILLLERNDKTATAN